MAHLIHSVGVVLTLLISDGLSFNYDLKYVEDFCASQRINLWDAYYDSTIVLKGIKGGHYNSPPSCNVTLSAPADGGLIVTMDEIDLSHGTAFPSDTLSIVVDNSTSKTWSGDLLDFDEQEYMATQENDNEIALRLQTYPKVNFHDGFKFIVTSFKNSGDACPENYFDCGHNRCIRGELICDSHNNCGNNRDEQACFYTGASGIIAFIIVVLMLLLCASLCNCLFKAKASSAMVLISRASTINNNLYHHLDATSGRRRGVPNYGSNQLATDLNDCEKAPAYEPPPPYPGLVSSKTARY